MCAKTHKLTLRVKKKSQMLLQVVFLTPRVHEAKSLQKDLKKQVKKTNFLRP